MRVHKLPVQKCEEFCELCNEYINCPICGAEIPCPHKGEVVDCEERHSFSIWEMGDGQAILVECEHIYAGKFEKARCAEESRSGHLADPASWSDDFACCGERCPLKYNE